MSLSGRFSAITQKFKRTPGPAAPDPAKFQAFIQACQSDDKDTVNKMARKKALPAEIFGEGLVVMLLSHKEWKGLDDLVAASEIQKNPSHFVAKTLVNCTSPEQQLEAIKFFADYKVPFQAQDAEQVLVKGNMQAFGEIVKSGTFDPRSGHSAILLCAATLDNKELFQTMLQMGANPQDALMNGPTYDPAYARGYKNLGAWLHELYVEQLTELVQKKANMCSLGPDGAPVPGAPPPEQITSLAYNSDTYSPGNRGTFTAPPAPQPEQQPEAEPVATPAAVPAPAAAATSTPPAKPINLDRYSPK